MKYVMLYEPDPAAPAEKRAAVFPQHQAWYGEFHARGELLMVGPFTDGTSGAMGVFTTREAAEAFIADDPFVANGIVRAWRILEWNEVLYR